ncbi:MAG: PAS domain S-box protein [Lentisphaeria bacterium]|nr:PAS domain S-box protein [Lentisphaeria bacterium]
MGITGTILLIFLEMTFIFVVMLLLYSQRKSIGETPFAIVLGMFLVYGEFLCGADLRFNGYDYVSFQIAPVVVFVPFISALLLVYISDGVLALQRLIIGALVTMGVFFYLGDLSRLQMRWVTYSVTGTLPLEAFDFLLERTRRSMLGVVSGQLAAFMVMPVVFSRLRNTGKNLFFCCCGAVVLALMVETLIYELLSFGSWQDKYSSLPPLLAVRGICGIYMAGLLALYITKIGRESESPPAKPLEILFAFIGGYGRSKLLEANLLEWEGRYRVILENASEMILVADRTGKILDANRAAAQLLPGNKLTGEDFAGFFNEHDAAECRRAFQQAESKSGSTGQFYVELLRKNDNNGGNDQVCYLALTVTALAIGSLQAFIIMGRDLTEERNLEAEKQRLNEELAHSQRMEALGQLAGGVAHDFNNNIHAILGHADLIAFNKTLDEKSRRHLGKIIEIAEHSGGLTSQLLGFARKGKYRESEFYLRVLVRRTAELFMPGSEDIEFTVETADKPLLVSGDQIQLQQVVLNLLINARDALRSVNDRERQLQLKLVECETSHLPEVLILPENIAPGSSAVLLSISDNGCGMDENTLKKMFEPFFTTKPVGQGTGMGMAMAYGTVQSHQGAIGVESEVDKGTTVYIVLPKIRK